MIDGVGTILLVIPGGVSVTVGSGNRSGDNPAVKLMFTAGGVTLIGDGVIVTGGGVLVTCGTGIVTSGTGISSGAGSPEVNDSDVTPAGGMIFFCGPL